MIELCKDYDGEWHRLRFFEEVIYEGHSIPTHAWIELIRRLGHPVSEFEWDAETDTIKHDVE